MAAYRDPEQVTFAELMEMPFVEQLPTMLLPSGEKPVRESLMCPGALLPEPVSEQRPGTIALAK